MNAQSLIGDRNMTTIGDSNPTDALQPTPATASPVSFSVPLDAPQPTPSTATTVLSSTPNAPIQAIHVSFRPPWLDDSMRYKVMVTPPAPIPTEQLITPEVEPVYTHVSYFFDVYKIIF